MSNFYQNKFSKNLQDYLVLSNISLSEFSKRIKIPKSTVHGWLNGVPPKNIFIIKKVANFMKISIDELCFSDDFSAIDNNLDIVLKVGRLSYSATLKPCQNSKA